MKFSKEQTDLLADYFSDLSKILFASLVVGFFVPSAAGPITIPVMLGGTLASLIFIIFSFSITK